MDTYIETKQQQKEHRVRFDEHSRIKNTNNGISVFNNNKKLNLYVNIFVVVLFYVFFNINIFDDCIFFSLKLSLISRNIHSRTKTKRYKNSKKTHTHICVF